MTEQQLDDGPIEPTVEDRAKLVGWHDPADEDFRGDPEHALGAEEFLKVAEERNPVLRENNKKLEDQVFTMQSQITQMKNDTDSYLDMQRKSMQAKYQEEQRSAVEDGDTERFDKATKAMEDIPTQTAPAQENGQDIFARDNDWFGIDVDKTDYAIKVDRTVAVRGLSPQEHRNEVARLVNEKFQSTPPNIQKNGHKKHLKVKGTFETMPQDAKDMCDRMAMYSKDPDFKKKYVKDYYAQGDE